MASFLAGLEQGYDIAEDLHRDVTGEAPGWDAPAYSPEKKSFMATVGVGLDLQSAADRKGQQSRDSDRLTQAAFEDELGRELAADPPRFVLELLGPPPRPSATPRVNLHDERWWTDQGRTFTPRGLWERAAGALAGCVYGRGIASDPDAGADVLSQWAADRQGPYTGPAEFERAAYVSFSHLVEVEGLVGQVARDLGRAPERGQ